MAIILTKGHTSFTDLISSSLHPRPLNITILSFVLYPKLFILLSLHSPSTQLIDLHDNPATVPLRRHKRSTTSPPASPKASDALPLPLYLTNTIFFTLFFSVAYYLRHRWRDKICSSTPLHVITFSELTAILSLIASFIYLIGFFGIDFVQSFISRPSNDVVWEDDIGNVVPQQIPKLPPSEPLISSISTKEDEEIVSSVVEGKTSSYSLESSLGDCRRATAIRREALQRVMGRSLQSLPLEGFDYESILGQFCEMLVGYVQIPVGEQL